jgi:uncharacterized protein
MKLNLISMRNINVLFFLSLLIFSCKDKEITPETEFEKKDILTNLADNWIIPAYTDFSVKLADLRSDWNAFKLSPNEVELNEVRNAWKETYLSFQNVKFIEFGPAMTIGFVGATGTFPSDTLIIENNISAGTYDLATFSNIPAIGLPALDYLFYQTDALSKLQTDANRRQYVDEILSKIDSEINYIITNWASYRATFIAGTGTSSTSPFSLLVNAYVKDFEIIKWTKIGIPLGKQSLGIQRLEYLETRNSKFGKELMIQNYRALKSVFLGNSFNGSIGIGFDDYLKALEKQTLASTIETRFDFLISEPQTWSTDLENLIVNENLTVENYYNYIHNSVVYLKTDMTSAFGILISYQDNDGD